MVCTDNPCTKMRKIFSWSRLFVAAIIIVAFIGYLNKTEKTNNGTKFDFKLVKGFDGSYQVVSRNESFNSSVNTQHLDINTNLKQYDLRVIVIVYNRAKSMLRLLNSLNEAKYEGDSVKLEVWIDKSVAGVIDETTVDTARKFTFLHGAYSVYSHPHHVGIYGQWLSTWKPQLNSSEIAVILEDDLTVSPYFYKYLKLVHKKYDNSAHINGFSLQGISMNHKPGTGQGTIKPPIGHNVYQYPVLGTWGFSPCTKNWIKFLKWFSVAFHEKGFKPYVPGNIVTSWYKTFEQQGRINGIWSIWFIYYAWENKEMTLYPAFGDHRGLTVNWQEPGLHYTAQAKPSNPVLQEWKPEYEHLPDTPLLIDLAGKVV